MKSNIPTHSSALAPTLPTLWPQLKISHSSLWSCGVPVEHTLEILDQRVRQQRHQNTKLRWIPLVQFLSDFLQSMLDCIEAAYSGTAPFSLRCCLAGLCAPDLLANEVCRNCFNRFNFCSSAIKPCRVCFLCTGDQSVWSSPFFTFRLLCFGFHVHLLIFLLGISPQTWLQIFAFCLLTETRTNFLISTACSSIWFDCQLTQ